MTATELSEILGVLRSHGVASAEVSPEGLVRVVFLPDAGPPPPGDDLTPGGWKGPTRLDSDPMDDERSVP